MPQLFDKAVITNEGFKLLAKAQAGGCKIVFTKISIGDGQYSETEKANLIFRTELKNQKNEYSAKSEITTDNNVRVKALITNRDPTTKKAIINSGYYINEMGLYAKEDTDGAQEVLYSIVLTSGSVGDYIPAYTSGAPAQINQSWIVAVGNAEVINVEVGDGSYVAKEQLENVLMDLLDTSVIEKAFKSTFSYLGTTEPEPGPDPDPEPDPDSDPEPEVDEMTEQDVQEAINKEWSGESSSDPAAMSEEDIQQAINTTWDGGSSSDPSALSKEEIYEAIALAEQQYK